MLKEWFQTLSSKCAYCILATTTVQPPTGQCNGFPSTDWSCCSSSNQCNLGGGDCDNDLDCNGTLTCGKNNCHIDFNSPGANWAVAADCCEGMPTMI